MRNNLGVETSFSHLFCKRKVNFMVALSSCLAGVKCRYNGLDAYSDAVMDAVGDDYILICPEILAGLKVPRVPCEIVGGSGEDVLRGKAKIVDKNGQDITDEIVLGSEKALEICVKNRVTKAYLKAKSPTCGCGKVYDGSFLGVLREGDGVFAAMLKENGVEVVSVE
jgi:uncharacterized protein YbbK (DUF523 family)